MYSASNRNDYQGYFLKGRGVKTAGARANNRTIFICLLSGNPGSLNFVEAQGPVQACNGISLHLPSELYLSSSAVRY
jgi:hypothetical protein